MRKRPVNRYTDVKLSTLKGSLERHRRNRRLIALPDSLDAKYGPVDEALVARYSELLERAAARPTLNEVLDRISHRSGGHISVDDVVRQLREERDSR
jgi:hypothetical protein